MKLSIFRDGSRCVFVGSVKIGIEGDSRQVEKTIRDLLKYKYQTEEKFWNISNKHVYIQIGEMSVKTIESNTGTVKKF